MGRRPAFHIFSIPGCSTATSTFVLGVYMCVRCTVSSKIVLFHSLCKIPLAWPGKHSISTISCITRRKFSLNYSMRLRRTQLSDARTGLFCLRTGSLAFGSSKNFATRRHSSESASLSQASPEPLHSSFPHSTRFSALKHAAQIYFLLCQMSAGPCSS